ncbi:MAG: type I methionyl aminopeptidase [Bdellovibrionales bacterium RIFOXYD1_FULL_53_11]|nr:MAG: type I methionyl aminopeptidase [Bdellovibrionales bacterium RIFOXYD1_FULL_53_11]
MIILKSEHEIEKMRAACRTVALILDEMARLSAPGITTGEINKFAEKRCKELKVVPAFKGYNSFPACVCISVNDEIIHGIPSHKRTLCNGDIVGLDFGVIQDGWYGDAACTVGIGTISEGARKLMEATNESLYKGISECREGNHLLDIGYAIQNYVEGLGYSVVREFVGHGIGRALHEEPQVPNVGVKGKGQKLKAGMVLAIEPMINAGNHKVKVLDDGWTAVTEDHSLSAHFEHTVAITPDGPEILTVR